MTSWQPIETAPRDGDVWVFGLAKTWSDSSSFQWQGQAGYDSDTGGWLTTAYDDEGNYLYVEATHWQPLPEPPAT